MSLSTTQLQETLDKFNTSLAQDCSLYDCIGKKANLDDMVFGRHVLDPSWRKSELQS